MVTISFVPDGTVLGTNSNGYVYSNLFAKMNARFGSPAVWESMISIVCAGARAACMRGAAQPGRVARALSTRSITSARRAPASGRRGSRPRR